jgi:hypothetical protein
MDDSAGVRLLTDVASFDCPDSMGWALRLGMERHILADPGCPGGCRIACVRGTGPRGCTRARPALARVPDTYSGWPRRAAQGLATLRAG